MRACVWVSDGNENMNRKNKPEQLSLLFLFCLVLKKERERERRMRKQSGEHKLKVCHMQWCAMGSLYDVLHDHSISLSARKMAVFQMFSSGPKTKQRIAFQNQHNFPFFCCWGRVALFCISNLFL